jgi:hypothetical protein
MTTFNFKRSVFVLTLYRMVYDTQYYSFTYNSSLPGLETEVVRRIKEVRQRPREQQHIHFYDSVLPMTRTTSYHNMQSSTKKGLESHYLMPSLFGIFNTRYAVFW